MKEAQNTGNENGIRTVRDDLTAQLRSVYPDNEARQLAEELMQYFAGVEKWRASTDPDKQLSEIEVKMLKSAVEELKNEKPLQYVTGKVEFDGMILAVDERVLIPRPETEELVRWVWEENKEMRDANILDIGTGSGCIAISLKNKLPGCNVFALDNSPGAIDLATENADRQTLDVTFDPSDIFYPENIFPGLRFRLIVSNPPYVRESEKRAIRKNVKGFEPAGALFVPDEDPLKYYRAIIEFAKKRLENKGAVYVEINETLGGKCVALFRENGFKKVEIKKDMNSKDRMVCASGLENS